VAQTPEERKAKNRTRVQAWREANREKVNEQARLRRANKPSEKTRETSRKWAAKNRERLNAYQRAYREANKETLLTQDKIRRDSESEEKRVRRLECGRQWRANNGEKRRQWYQANREEILAYRKVYCEENKEKIRVYAKKYREEDGGKHLPKIYIKKKRKEIIEKLGSKCAKCGFDNIEALHIDHVLNNGSKHRKGFMTGVSGGSYNLAYLNSIWLNIESGEYQLLCPTCNQIKYHETLTITNNES
jgi:hypothetical protein